MSISLLRLPAVLSRYPRGRSGLYADIEAGIMVPPVKLGVTSAWPEHEIEAVIRARIAGQPEEEIRALVIKLVGERSAIAA